ncbi:MFS transporter [Achromobacter aloeverae]|uniref:MFS transporter n=1 Tax=Achromobacter aloeverae TaxID=1750518 RepID=A0A4Q1HKL8_9BURK|nr:MFS transporter [Achromobacter aloeverae]RXN87835.1 MFS transporter [Achromobacter aloeverae]
MTQLHPASCKPGAQASLPPAHGSCADASSDSVSIAAPKGRDAGSTLTPALTLLLAASVGVIVTNLFAPQTLVAPMAASLGLDMGHSGLIAMMTLLGYACGLFLLVPLADLVENRRLVLVELLVAIAAAGTAAVAGDATGLMAALFVLGMACSAIQVLVPIAADMAAPAQRGRVIGDVMGGLMVGILLARPIASLIAQAWGWRGFYVASALGMSVIALVLVARLPRRRPVARDSYGALIASLWGLLRGEPVLRRRSLSAALAMAAFSLYWSAVALRLAQAPFGFDQVDIAVFALVGAGGAIATPWFGRAGDRGWTRSATLAADALMIAGFGVAAWAGWTRTGSATLPMIAMGMAAVLLDVGVTGDQTLGRRAINMLRPEARGRINGLFVGLFFLGGAAGSALAGIAWVLGGWPAVCVMGAIFSAAALVVGMGGREGAHS